MAHGEKLAADLFRDSCRLLRVAVSDSKRLRAAGGHVAPGKAVDKGNREEPVVAFHCQQIIDQAAKRLVWREIETDHAAVKEGHRRPNLPIGRVGNDIEEIGGAICDIGMRVLLVEYNGIGRIDHRLGHIAVKVELDADCRIWPYYPAYTLDDVGLAVVIAVGHHGAVQAKQDDVYGQCLLQTIEEFISKAFIGDAGCYACGLCPGVKAEDIFPAASNCARLELVEGCHRAFLDLIAWTNNQIVSHAGRHW